MVIDVGVNRVTDRAVVAALYPAGHRPLGVFDKDKAAQVKVVGRYPTAAGYHVWLVADGEERWIPDTMG